MQAATKLARKAKLGFKASSKSNRNREGTCSKCGKNFRSDSLKRHEATCTPKLKPFCLPC